MSIQYDIHIVAIDENTEPEDDENLFRASGISWT